MPAGCHVSGRLRTEQFAVPLDEIRQFTNRQKLATWLKSYINGRAIASHMLRVWPLRGAPATKQSRPLEIASLSLAMTGKRSSDAIALDISGLLTKFKIWYYTSG